MKHKVIAWTGGSVPAPIAQIDSEERATVRELFRDQMKIFREFWGSSADRDTRRLFWRRARFDAHATHRSLELTT